MTAFLIAVALSLSSASQYRYTEIVETNLLTNVGMGRSVPAGDISLSYTDVAFLKEAYAERYFINLVQATPPSKGSVDKTVSSKGILHDSLFPMSYVQHIDGWFPVNGFLSTNSISTSFTDTPVRAYYYEAHNSDAYYGSPLWYDLMMGKNLFAVATVTNSPFSSGQPISANDVSTMYNDLSQIGAFAYGDLSYGIGSKSDTLHRESRIFAGLIRDYDVINHQFVYNDNYTPASGHSTNEDYMCSYFWRARAIKQKNRGFEYNSENRKYEDVTGVIKSSGYEDESSVKNLIGDAVSIALPFSPEQHEIEVKSVRAFALTSASCSRKLNGQFVFDVGGYVAVPIHASYSEGRVMLPMGGELDRVIYNAAFEVFGFQLKTGSELLSSVEEPQDPSTIYASYAPTDNVLEVSIGFEVERVYIVIDYDFNAKTL